MFSGGGGGVNCIVHVFEHSPAPSNVEVKEILQLYFTPLLYLYGMLCYKMCLSFYQDTVHLQVFMNIIMNIVRQLIKWHYLTKPVPYSLFRVAQKFSTGAAGLYICNYK